MSQDVSFTSPSMYVEGNGLILRCKDYIKKLGSRAIILTSNRLNKMIGSRLSNYLQSNGVSNKVVIFGGQSSMKEITRIAKLATEFQAQVIIGLGGGRVLDSAKATANKIHIHVAIFPSLASTDSPCTRLSVIYNDDGSFSHYWFYNSNPDLVLVDTKLLTDAPKRFLVSGIGDALATNVEAQAVEQSHGDNLIGKKQTLFGLAIAQKCEDTLFKYGKEAVTCVGVNADTTAVNKVIEANILMSGLGAESGGLAAAHALYNGTTAYGKIPRMHGEIVAFGLLTQLFLEGAGKYRLNKYLDFELSVGSPTNFKELGVPTISDEDLMQIAKVADSPKDTMTEMPMKITPYMIVQAMRGANAYSRMYEAEHRC